MRLSPIKILLLIGIFIPFENFVLKWVPGGDFIRFLPEFIMYGLLFHEFVKKVVYEKYYISTPINKLFLLFIFLAIASFIYNWGPILEGIRNFRNLIRYITAYYIVIYNDAEKKDLRYVIDMFLIILCINIAVGFFQRVFGVSSFWLPKNGELEIAGMSTGFKSVNEGGGGGREIGSVMGLTGDTVYLGLFLLISIPLVYFQLIYDNRNKLVILAILLCSVALQFFTYSKGALIATVGGIGACFLILKEYKKIIFIVLSGVILIPIMSVMGDISSEKKKQSEEETSPIENITMLFDDTYIDGLKNSRMWVLRDVGKQVFKLELPLGYSSSPNYARAMIAKNSNTDEFDKLIEFDAMEDVYWVAMVAYYGYVGLSVFVAILIVFLNCSLFVYRRTNNIEMRIISGAFIAVLASTFIMTFIVRTFELRIFSFYFWLIPAFIMKEYLAIKNGKFYYEPQEIINENITN
jgi:hypothetical protein